MDIDFDDFITPAPSRAAAFPTDSDTQDDLIRMLSSPPGSSSSSMPPPPPPADAATSVYRPNTAPSYAAPAQFAASRPTPVAASLAVTGGGRGLWNGIKSFFVGSGTPAMPYVNGGVGVGGGAHRADTAMAVRKRKRKLLREMRSMLDADAVALARTRALTGDGGGEDNATAYQMRCTEASSLEEIEEEHDLVTEEHNERVGMETARTAFVTAVGRVEAFNDEWAPLGDEVKLQGFEELVKDSIGDYESDIQTLRESILGLGLPQWCYTAAKLGITGAIVVATNRMSHGLVDSGVDQSIAYHPMVRDAMRGAVAQQLAEAARRDQSGGGGGGGSAVGRAGPGPPVFVNNKPRMPDPDMVPRPGGGGAAAQFVSEPTYYSSSSSPPIQHQQYQHDRYAYVAPVAHPSTQPIVSVPLMRPQANEAARDGLGDRAAYKAQQNAFRDAQMTQQQQYQQQQARPDLAPPVFGVPANFNMQYSAPSSVPYSSLDRPRASVLASMGYPEPAAHNKAAPPIAFEDVVYEEQPRGGGGGGGEEDDAVYGDFFNEDDENEQTVEDGGASSSSPVSSRKRPYEGYDHPEHTEPTSVFEELLDDEASAVDARSLTSTATGGKRRRRGAKGGSSSSRSAAAASFAEDDLAMSMM